MQEAIRLETLQGRTDEFSTTDAEIINGLSIKMFNKEEKCGWEGHKGEIRMPNSIFNSKNLLITFCTK